MSVVEVFFKGVIFIRVNDYIIVLDEDVFIFKKKIIYKYMWVVCNIMVFWYWLIYYKDFWKKNKNKNYNYFK